MQTKHCWWCCVAELYMHVRVCVRAKRALRLSWSNFSVLSMCRWNAVLRSHPAVSASHSGWEKRPEGWMDERQEVLHAIEGGFSLATSLWAESAFLGLCAPMSVCVCVCAYVCLRSYVSGRKLPRRNVYSHCLQLDVGVRGTHGVNKGQAQERTERQTGEFQVTS